MPVLKNYIIPLGMFFCMLSSFAASTTETKEKTMTFVDHVSVTPEFTPVWPHGDIEEIFQHVFFVTGTNKIQHEGADIQTSRNMAIIRHDSELTLVNTVRLNEEGLRKLEALGRVAHIVRIGAFHGRDDAFYRHRYPEASLWALKGMTYENGLQPDRELIPGGAMPFPACSLFVFETST